MVFAFLTGYSVREISQNAGIKNFQCSFYKKSRRVLEEPEFSRSISKFIFHSKQAPPE